MDTINIGNKSINYFKFGTGKKTMVMIPGLNVNSVLNFSDVVKHDYDMFSKDYTVYLFDRRNDIEPNYSISDMASDYIEAFKNLGLKDIYLFGTSQGGMISMVISLKCNLVKKMVLGSTTPIVSSKEFSIIQSWIDLAKENKCEELSLSFAKYIYTKEIFDKFRDALIEVSKTYTKLDLERFIICASAIKDFNILESIKNIKCDALFISDKTDMLLGDKSDLINSFNKSNFKTIVLDGYGHVAYDFAPNYKELIYNFFKGE